MVREGRTAGPEQAPGGSPGRPGRARRNGMRRVPGWAPPLIPGIVLLVADGYRLGRLSLWRDEAYTVDAAGRPLPRIVAMLGRTDAVNGAYYLLMHAWTAVAGTSAAALRLPSLLAMAVAAVVTAAICRRLARAGRLPAPALTGVVAGLLFAAAPQVTRYAQDARAYGLVTMCATVATYLLLRAAGDARWRWWAGYGAAITATGLFNLLAFLLVAAHGAAGGRCAAPGSGGSSAGVPLARRGRGGHRGAEPAAGGRVRAAQADQLAGAARPGRGEPPGGLVCRVAAAGAAAGPAAADRGDRHRGRPAPGANGHGHGRGAVAGAARRGPARGIPAPPGVRRPLPRLLPARTRPAQRRRAGVGNPFCRDDPGAGGGRRRCLAAGRPDPGAAGGAAGGTAAVGAARPGPAGRPAPDRGDPGRPGQARGCGALRASEQPGVQHGVPRAVPAAAGR